MSFSSPAWLYLLPFLVALLFYLRRHRKTEIHHRSRLEETKKSGIPEPLTLHPVIDINKCFGSGACVKACPERALGLVGRKAVLVQPDHCIGHGACEAACPVEAISLVFGTEKRGIDIPQLKPTFETNDPCYTPLDKVDDGAIKRAEVKFAESVKEFREKSANPPELKRRIA